jgi:DnaK suppressor protein
MQKNKKLTGANIVINNDLELERLQGINLEKNYIPSSKEDYMSDKQLKFFHAKLLDWKQQLVEESDNTLLSLQDKHMQEPDDNDRASAESDTNLELRTRERYLKLISKIDQALLKIKNGNYGYCEETEDEIGIKRLIARPIASLSIEAQTLKEKKEKLMHEDIKEE